MSLKMLRVALCFVVAASCVAAAPHQASGMTGVCGNLAFAPAVLPLGRSQHTCVNAATKKKKAPAKAGGFGAATKNGAAARKTSSTATIDAAGLLRKSVDLYESFLAKGTVEQEFDDDVFTEFKEYVVSVRAPGAKGADQVSDWVPAALMCVYWQGGQLEDNPLLQGIADHNMACKPALKQMRREVWECACQVSPTLRKVARDAVEYAYEPLDGFHNILDEARSNGGSAAEAFKTLGLSPGAPAAEIKSSHRKLIRSLHPDTLGSMEGEERAAAEERFKRVQNAYEVLGGGQGEEGDSWYASLGGKSRHDTFTGAVKLDDSVGVLPSQYWITAVQAVDSDISREFFVRNTARANLRD